MMKKYIFITVLAIFAVSCSLKENLKSSSKIEDTFTDEEQCRTGVNSCYNSMRSILGGQSFWLITDCETDCITLNSTTQYLATLDISPSRPSFASNVWQHSYVGVMRSNQMLYAIENCRQQKGCSDAAALSLTAETITLRAFFYYILTCTFGDVPFYTEVVTEENREAIASLPRMSANDTRDYLIDELMEYLKPVSEGGKGAFTMKRSYDAPVDNRLGASVALMLVGKMAMWNERWDDAIKALTMLEAIYGKYDEDPLAFGQVYPLSDVPFVKKFTKECILEIANVFEPYGIQQGGYIAVLASPVKSKSSDTEEVDYNNKSDVYAGIGIPELGNLAYISTSPARPTSYYYRNVLTYDSPDLRGGEYSADSDVARGGSGNLAWRWKGYAASDKERKPANLKVRWFKSSSSATATNMNKNSKPWMGNKFWCPEMNYNMDYTNPKFFRYADALLMLAECYLEKGDVERSAKYLNVTRLRAGLTQITLSSVGGEKEAFMEEIRLERARELFGEFQRKFDLVRWGIWYERTKANNDGEYLSENIKPYHRYLPIPAEQITYSHGALDNNEYGE